MKWLTYALLTFVITIQGCSNIVGATRDEPIATDPTNRTIGTRIDDERIEVIAMVNIHKANPQLKYARIEVDSFNGVVLLTGQVATAGMREQVANVVKDIDKVRQVHNELQIQSNIPFGVRAHDAWIVTKLKTQLLADKNIVGSKIKVIAENGTIYLMGLVEQNDAEVITDIASRTRGVNGVVRVFEYVDLANNDTAPAAQVTNGVILEPGLQIIENNQ